METEPERDCDEPLSDDEQIANARTAVTELTGHDSPEVSRFDLSTWLLVQTLVGRAHVHGYVEGKADGFLEGKNASITAAARTAREQSIEYEVVCPTCSATMVAMGTHAAGVAASAHIAASPECASVPLGINRRAQVGG
jgi:hypothetical protein